MNVVGIITEHNPYHNGHLYHVDMAREVCGADYVISVMSGHFLQRGEPALFNKWARAKMAILGGVDIVIELPTAYSVRSASAFAMGSVALLNATGVVTHICFGSESGSLDELLPSARILADEPREFKILLAEYLGAGLSYPVARARAITRLMGGSGNSADIHSSPNNILGIEYLRSLILLKSSIKPVTIRRFSAGYHDRSMDGRSAIASATSIRDELQVCGRLTEDIRRVVPESTFTIMHEETGKGHGPVFLKDCAEILFYLLRTMPVEKVAGLLDVGEGLENRICEVSRSAGSVMELIAGVKTKRYTWTRIQRILCYILLGYTKEQAEVFDRSGPLYIRILGLSAKGRELLKKIKKNAAVPAITRTVPYLARADEMSGMLQFDVRATDLYALLCPAVKILPQGLDCKMMPFTSNLKP